MKETQLKRNVIYNSSFLQVYEDDVDIDGKQAKRVVVDHSGAVSIIAINNEEKLILVRQFRYPVDQYTYETPAGKLDKNISIEETAHEELEEETGYRTDSLKLIGEYYTAVGFCNEKMHVFFTDQLEKVENPKACDDDEYIDLVAITLVEAKELIQKGLICDYKTLHAVMIYEDYLKKRQ
ncbi:NUDIX hydrolase [Haloplasma contractile]|uniref:ADP-ribose pyrophosphatase protein n=1 Tax=Haloplasma contractile SSD-17B TaxID=1033810 RepID=U2FM04_9MOLU|nr:NUDIX hydrolase [Haloplasma contractile]ERJ13765.1 ADP-ribose pyrophosphatase protein [Haloplasma contractile SSD-17B]